MIINVKTKVNENIRRMHGRMQLGALKQDGIKIYADKAPEAWMKFKAPPSFGREEFPNATVEDSHYAFPILMESAF